MTDADMALIMALTERLAAARVEIKGLRAQLAMRDAGVPLHSPVKFGGALDRLEADPKPAKFTGAMLRCKQQVPLMLAPLTEGAMHPCGAGAADVAPDYEIGPRDCVRWTCTMGHPQAHGWLFESHAVEGGGTAP